MVVPGNLPMGFSLRIVLDLWLFIGSGTGREYPEALIDSPKHLSFSTSHVRPGTAVRPGDLRVQLDRAAGAGR